MTFAHLFRPALMLIVAVVATGCAAAPPRVVVAPAPADWRRMVELLRVRIAEISVDRLPVGDAIEKIAAEVHRAYGNDVFFTPIFTYSRANLPFLSRRPVRRADLHFYNPRVSLHATDITTGEALARLCGQAGWCYQQTNSNEVLFLDGPPDAGNWIQPDPSGRAIPRDHGRSKTR